MKFLAIMVLVSAFFLAGCAPKVIDLSTPESSAQVCIDALIEGDKDVLLQCLSENNLRVFLGDENNPRDENKSDEFIEFWQYGIDFCGSKVVGSEVLSGRMYAIYENSSVCMIEEVAKNTLREYHNERSFYT